MKKKFIIISGVALLFGASVWAEDSHNNSMMSPKGDKQIVNLAIPESVDNRKICLDKHVHAGVPESEKMLDQDIKVCLAMPDF